MTVYLQDPDVTLHHGDALEVLRSLPSESVHCVVTSPPFYGLRSYLDAGHVDKPLELGLEDTPELWVERLVAVFREVRRVLRPDGTLWLEVGDSYNSRLDGSHGGWDSHWTGKPGKRLGGTEGRPGRYAPGVKPKDLIGAPWLLAFALRADGWYLRSDIIWARPNPMPESVTDRPTKAHSYVFLLSKRPRYFWDAEAVREPAEWAAWGAQTDKKRDLPGSEGVRGSAMGYDTYGRQRIKEMQGGNGSRNVRSVWTIPTQPYPEAHFATFPEQLARRCILAGTSEHGCCPECGTPWVRETESEFERKRPGGNGVKPRTKLRRGFDAQGYTHVTTLGWRPSCDHETRGVVGQDRPLGHSGGTETPCVVLDPFVGSGTVPYVARLHGRHAIGIDLSESYLQLAAKRLAQQSLFASVP